VGCRAWRARAPRTATGEATPAIIDAARKALDWPHPAFTLPNDVR
jgi:hypothetical protein